MYDTVKVKYILGFGHSSQGMLCSNQLIRLPGTGEPALCLATVILHAFREAVRSGRIDAGYPDQWVEIGMNNY